VVDAPCLAKQMCECLWFAERACEAGLAPERIGCVGQFMRVVVLPADGEGITFRPECLFADMVS